jgi:hypothetical protein
MAKVYDFKTGKEIDEGLPAPSAIRSDPVSKGVATFGDDLFGRSLCCKAPIATQVSYNIEFCYCQRCGRPHDERPIF